MTFAVIAHLKEIAKSTKDSKEIAQVGNIRANGDAKIGRLLGDAMEKVGKGVRLDLLRWRARRDVAGYTGPIHAAGMPMPAGAHLAVKPDELRLAAVS